MSTQINQQMIDLDDQAQHWLKAFIEAKAKIAEWKDKADLAQEHIKAALGECEIGLVNGKESVRWTRVESKRVDVKKLRELLPPEVVGLVEVTTETRRFTVVGDEE